MNKFFSQVLNKDNQIELGSEEMSRAALDQRS